MADAENNQQPEEVQQQQPVEEVPPQEQPTEEAPVATTEENAEQPTETEQPAEAEQPTEDAAPAEETEGEAAAEPEAEAVPEPEEEPKEQPKWMVFALGTNNWQGGGEFAPGSGILHESHHTSFRKLQEVGGMYSMWPSSKQKSDPERADYRVFELSHDIPICESVSPVSSYRWHSMSEEEFYNYRARLTREVEEYIAEAEEKEGREFNLFIAHHTFVNPTVLVEINRRRVAAGRAAVPVIAFAHGTALKMYQNEKRREPEFPKRFLPFIQKQRTFADDNLINGVFVISAAQKDTFLSVFDSYPADKVIVATNGYNQEIFREVEGATAESVLSKLAVSFYDGLEEKLPSDESREFVAAAKENGIDTTKFDKYVLYTGRFADWKRLDVFLQAAKQYRQKMLEEHNCRVATLVVGGGAEADEVLYRDLALVELGMAEHTFFLGRQPQDVLAGINTITNVAAFPSHDEPFGLVFIEAMGCGCPVIGAKSGGPLDIVTDAVGTLIDENEDKVALAEVLANTVVTALVDDWKTTKKEACIETAIEKYSLLHQCSLMLDTVEREFTNSVEEVEEDNWFAVDEKFAAEEEAAEAAKKAEEEAAAAAAKEEEEKAAAAKKAEEEAAAAEAAKKAAEEAEKQAARAALEERKAALEALLVSESERVDADNATKADALTEELNAADAEEESALEKEIADKKAARVEEVTAEHEAESEELNAALAEVEQEFEADESVQQLRVRQAVAREEKLSAVAEEAAQNKSNTLAPIEDDLRKVQAEIAAAEAEEAAAAAATEDESAAPAAKKASLTQRFEKFAVEAELNGFVTLENVQETLKILPNSFDEGDIRIMLTDEDDCDEFLEKYAQVAGVSNSDLFKMRTELIALVGAFAEYIAANPEEEVVEEAAPATEEAPAAPVEEAAAATPERTFIAIKPDGTQRQQVGSIIRRFEKTGYKLIALKIMQPTVEQAQQHYIDLADKKFYNGLCEYFASGAIVAMVWEGEGVIKGGRVLLGATNPADSTPGTIRGDGAVEVGRNVCHGSDGFESAAKEIAFWFAPEELVSYDLNSAAWIYEAPVAAAAPAAAEEAKPEEETAVAEEATEEAAAPAESTEETAVEEAAPVEEEAAPVEEVKPVDEPSEFENELQQKIADLEASIAGKKIEHEEALEMDANLKAQTAELRSNIAETEDRLQVDTETVQQLRVLEDRARIVAGKLERSENFMTRVEQWVDGPFTTDVEVRKTNAVRAAESDVLARIHEHLTTRGKFLKELERTEGKLRENAAHLREGHQREPLKKTKGFEEVLTPQAKAFERLSSPRRLQATEEPQTARLRQQNDEAVEELQILVGQIRSLNKQKGEYQHKILQQKHDAKRQVTNLQNEIRRQENQTAHDNRKTAEIEAANAAMMNTLEVNVRTLKIMHYGATGGPTTKKITEKEQQKMIEQ